MHKAPPVFVGGGRAHRDDERGMSGVPERKISAAQGVRMKTELDDFQVPGAALTPIARALGIALLGVFGLGLVIGWLWDGHATTARADSTGSVTGSVVDAEGPVGGARVRVRATDNFTSTTTDGGFTLGSLIEGQKIEVAAWADGYYITSTHVTPTVRGVTLTLRRYHMVDHPEYVWTSPISGTSPGACGNCHPMIVSQWITNGHGGAVFNPRFYSLYNGTDLTGAVSIGPGYLNDFPGTAGNCANCHAPGAGVDGYLNTNMNSVRSMVTATIHCDYCHKVGGVYLNPATQSVYPNAPGVRSQRMLRPPPGDNIFFGPYDDIKDPDTRLPLISESAYCAPCHQFSMWGTPVYESYNEWLASAYAEAGITCQKCHMPPTGDVYFALPEVGGLPHPPERIPSHLQRGALDVALLQDTVAMNVSTQQVADRILVTVTITNTGAGHHVPTDHPGRHMILTVRATDSQGYDLDQLAGESVPAWGGAQAGLPGKAYAKVLQDIVTGEAPVVSYWKQTRILNDNRIAALASDTSTYILASPSAGGAITITAELRFRRAFQEVMDVKGWGAPDILMEEAHVSLATGAVWNVYLPIVRVDSIAQTPTHQE